MCLFFFLTLHIQRGRPRNIVANELHCDIVVSEFKLQSRYYVHFRNNTLGKGMDPLNATSYGLNSTLAVILRR